MSRGNKAIVIQMFNMLMRFTINEMKVVWNELTPTSRKAIANYSLELELREFNRGLR